MNPTDIPAIRTEAETASNLVVSIVAVGCAGPDGSRRSDNLRVAPMAAADRDLQRQISRTRTCGQK